MGRKPAVSRDDFVKAVLLFDGLLTEKGELQTKGSKIWQDISIKLDGKMSPNNVWTALNRNQWDALHAYAKEFNVRPVKLAADSSEKSETASPSDASTSPVSIEHLPKETFLVTLTPEEWVIMKPVKKIFSRKERGSSRTRLVLPGNEWESVVVNSLWSGHKLPCAYIFKRTYVYPDPSTRTEFVKLTASCKDCGAVAEGVILDEPAEGEGATLRWRAPNTLQIPHSHKRPLRGKERRDASKVLLREYPSVYRTAKARSLMDFNDPEPPHLAANENYRKARQEAKLEELGLKGIAKGKDPVTTLAVMKYTQPYVGSIHDISLDKFAVVYCTPEQKLVFRNYCKENKITYVVFDATGTLVERLMRPHSGKSGNIFLYEGVILVEQKQVPVIQMLSEKHDSNSILYWLNEWERSVQCAPNEVVCDASPAFLSALSRSFGRCASLNDYMNRCFKVLTSNEGDLPPCFIRLDVAHFIKAASNWEALNRKSSRLVKDFYIRCLGLLIQCTTFRSFEGILKDVLTVSLSETISDGLDGTENPSFRCRARILSRIATMNTLDLKEEEEEVPKTETHLPDVDTFEEGSSFVELHAPRTIKAWLASISDEVNSEISRNAHCENPSAYFSPEIAKNFTRISHSLVLWSGVMAPLFKSPMVTASSASVESDFNNLKTRILASHAKRLSIPAFIATHLQYIQGAFNLTQAAMTKHKREPEKDQIKTGESNSGTSELQAIKTADEESDESFERTNHLTPQEFDAIPETNEEAFIKKECDSDSIIPYSDASKIDTVEAECEDTAQHDVLTETLPNERSLSSPFDLNFSEDWRGLGKIRPPPKKRKSTYLSACPEAEAVHEANILKLPKNVLLKNGSQLLFYKHESNMVRVINTCAFDATCQGLAYAYIANASYREFSSESQSKFLEVVRSLALAGATKETYLLRIGALSPFLPTVQTSAMVTRQNSGKRQNSRKKDGGLCITYDCFGNLTQLLNELMIQTPSVTLNYKCVSCSEEAAIHKLYVQPPLRIFSTQSLSEIDVVINEELSSQRLKSRPCGKCPDQALLTSQEIWPHFMVDIEVLPSLHETRKFKIEELKPYINVVGAKLQLVCVVVHQPGHYVSYCRRTDGTWDYFNDLSSCARMNVGTNIDIAPHLLIYVLDKGKSVIDASKIS